MGVNGMVMTIVLLIAALGSRSPAAEFHTLQAGALIPGGFNSRSGSKVRINHEGAKVGSTPRKIIRREDRETCFLNLVSFFTLGVLGGSLEMYQA